MGHLIDISNDDLSPDVLAHGKGQSGPEIMESGALDQVSEMDCENMFVRHFDTDG
jgi:hypothetical protein